MKENRNKWAKEVKERTMGGGEMGNGREIKEERVEERAIERVGRGTASEPTRKLSESSRIQTEK
jgi:hypothetical protein